MSRTDLNGARILVVEDEYLLADDARTALIDAGARVVGPVPSADEARMLIATDLHIDAVVLDINLNGEMVFEIADLLDDRGIPFAFVTGYDRRSLPARFSDATCMQKPVVAEDLVLALVRAIGA